MVRQAEKHEKHRFYIYGAMLCFLHSFCCVMYSITLLQEETRYYFKVLKTIYFILLISHIVLAGLSNLPFILITFIRGYTHQIPLHWEDCQMGVSCMVILAVTGPLCYLMLYPCYSWWKKLYKVFMGFAVDGIYICRVQAWCLCPGGPMCRMSAESNQKWRHRRQGPQYRNLYMLTMPFSGRNSGVMWWKKKKKKDTTSQRPL